MAHDDIEIELKFPLINAEKTKVFLNEKASLVTEDAYQKDIYYTPAHRDFLAEKYPFEWLRLRETKKWLFITYKHFYPKGSEKTDYSDEFETEIWSIEVMQKLFSGLDIEERVIVEKWRTTWQLEDVEIVVDKVSKLWYYIELEATKGFSDPKDWKKYLYEVLERLWIELGEEDYRGYPFVLLDRGLV